MKPRIYETVIHVIKRDIDMGTVITLENLKEDLRTVYTQRYAEFKKEQHPETVLYAKEQYKKRLFKKVFKGDCRNCGKKGHNAADCWQQEKNKDNRPANFKPKSESAYNVVDQKRENCTYCGRDNHTVEQCLKKQRDEKYKPAGNMKETAEIVIMAAEDISRDETKNLFIADSGATSHMRNSLKGMYDVKDWEVEVKVGNSSTMKSLKKGSF